MEKPNKNQTPKKEITTLMDNIYKRFIKLDWIHYLERDYKKGRYIKKIIFRYEKQFIVEFPLTEYEYKYWRSIKPKFRQQKIGEQLK